MCARSSELDAEAAGSSEGDGGDEDNRLYRGCERCERECRSAPKILPRIPFYRKDLPLLARAGLQNRHDHYVTSTAWSCKSCQGVVRQNQAEAPETHRARGERQAKRWC